MRRPAIGQKHECSLYPAPLLPGTLGPVLWGLVLPRLWARPARCVRRASRSILLQLSFSSVGHSPVESSPPRHSDKGRWPWRDSTWRRPQAPGTKTKTPSRQKSWAGKPILVSAGGGCQPKTGRLVRHRWIRAPPAGGHSDRGGRRLSDHPPGRHVPEIECCHCWCSVDGWRIHSAAQRSQHQPRKDSLIAMAGKLRCSRHCSKALVYYAPR